MADYITLDAQNLSFTVFSTTGLPQMLEVALEGTVASGQVF